MDWSTGLKVAGGARIGGNAVGQEDRRQGRQTGDGEKMPERRRRVTTGGGRGLFQIDVDGSYGFRPATTAEVDAALRQWELGIAAVPQGFHRSCSGQDR